MTAVLAIENVHKWFGDNQVLGGVSLEVHRHQAVALIGSSGSGKSTLLKTINLLERVDDGRIFLAGQDITDPRVDADAVRGRIGVVFQHYNLFPHLSVLSNVTLALRKVKGIPKREADEKGRALLSRIGLADKASAFPDRLSGDSSSGWRSSGRSPRIPNCCCSTRSPPRSIHSWWARCWISCGN